jgi:hypothetical protein
MIVVIAISTLIFGVITWTIVFFYTTNAYVIEQSDAVSAGRAGIEELVSDIRESTYSDIGSYPVVSMATTSVVFYSDVDLDTNVEYIRYYLSGTEFRRDSKQATGNPLSYTNAATTTSVIARNVRNGEQGIPIFTYYNEDGDVITNMSQVSDLRFVSIRLIVNVNPNRLPNEFVIRSSATLRNIVSEN